jgi:uncharacterized membrane protein
MPKQELPPVYLEQWRERAYSPPMKKRSGIARWRADFFTGLAIVLPVVVSIGILVWLFGTVSNVTNALLFFVPHDWTHRKGGEGIYWYWSVVALLLAVVLISLTGRFARNFIGKKLIALMDQVLLNVPLLNKIYGMIKQVNEAFSPSGRSSFRQVVLVRFPHQGHYAIGFLTGEDHQEVQAKTRERVVSVFVPTTPNPTSGFLVLVPEKDVAKLDMSVADAIKFIISLGSVSPGYTPSLGGKTFPVPGSSPDELRPVS